jgi:predicted Holliday junction resolvase-like endonuclease
VLCQSKNRNHEDLLISNTFELTEDEYMTDILVLIRQLKQSNLYAQCQCGGEFKLSRAVLFDGSKPFPPEAIALQKLKEDELKERENDIDKRKKLASEKAEITAKAVNIGKKLEVIFPTLKDFNWTLPDCRYLGDPIDMVIFNGASTDNISSINFVEIKSGNARLNKHQKAVKEAIEDKKVTYKVLK